MGRETFNTEGSWGLPIEFTVAVGWGEGGGCRFSHFWASSHMLLEKKSCIQACLESTYRIRIAIIPGPVGKHTVISQWVSPNAQSNLLEGEMGGGK